MKTVKTTLAMVLAVILFMQGFLITSVQAENAAPEQEAETLEWEGVFFDPARKNAVELKSLLSNVPSTFEIRAKFAENPGQRQILFGNYRSGAQSNFNIEIKADNQFRYYELSNGKLIDRSTTGLAITTGEWTHLAVTRDVANKKVSLIQDGVVVATFDNLELPEQVALESLHSIGKDTRDQMHMRAEVAEVRLWSDIRTLDELKTNVDADMQGDEEGLMHAWILDSSLQEPTVDTVYDKAGNIDGTPYGFEKSFEIEMPYESQFKGTGTDFSNGQLEIAVQERLAASPRTVEAWVNVPADTSSGLPVGTIFGNNESFYYNDVSRLSFEIGSNGNPRLFWRAHKNYEINYIANVNVNVGDWVHVAMVLDDEKNTVSAYINGEKMDEEVLTAPIPTDNLAREPKIGSDYSGYESDGTPKMNFKGQIADVRVWSTARTEEEIKSHHNVALQGNEAGLIGNWRLETDVDGLYPDSSVNSNDGYIYDDEAYNWLDPNFAEGDYTIAVVPDTQYLARLFPDALKGYTTWLKDHADEMNIKLAIGVGDIVDTPNSTAEWAVASEAYSYLDGVVPYVLPPGNHDVILNKSTLTRDYTNYNKYFPYSKYSQLPTFGGAYVEGNMENAYHYFNIGDVEYMVVSLGFGPNDEVLDWANEMVAANPDKRVIMTTHAYMYHNGEHISHDHIDHPNAYISDANNGDDMFNEFISRHDNVIMVLSGHIGYPDIVLREDSNKYGSAVNQLLADGQFMQPRDLGMLMLLTFKEGSNNVDVNWYSVKNDQLYREKNQFSMELNLYPEAHTYEQLSEKLVEAEQFVSYIEGTDGLSVPNMDELQELVKAAKALTEEDEAARIDEVYIDLTWALLQAQDSIQYSFIPKDAFTIDSYSSYDDYEDNLPHYILDGDYSTLWHTRWQEPASDFPHWIIIDMKESFKLSGIQRTSRPRLTAMEFPREFELYASDELSDLSDPDYLADEANRASGTFGKTAEGNVYQDFTLLDKELQGRYVKLVINSTYGTGTFTSMSEIDFTGVSAENPPAEPVQLYAEDLTVHSGDIFTLPVKVERASQLAGIEGAMLYDDELLTLESFELAGFGETGAVSTSVNGRIGFAAVSESALGTDEEVIIGNAVFRAKADLTSGAQAAISFENVHVLIVNAPGEYTYEPAVTADATVTIVSGLIGDMDGNNRIDIMDASLILKLIVGALESDDESMTDIADVNGDQTVDTLDVLVLLKMIADDLANVTAR